MTPGTYSTHLKHTYAKLGVESRTAAVACASTKAWSTRRTRHVGKWQRPECRCCGRASVSLRGFAVRTIPLLGDVAFRSTADCWL
jgi:hypothetical protein